MVHNGIEYADMQLITEAYDLLKTVYGLEAAAIADIFARWKTGDLDSYLIEITAAVLRKQDAAPAGLSSIQSSTRPSRRAPAAGPPAMRSISACR